MTVSNKQPEFGRQMLAARKALGLKQKEAAKLADVKYRTYQGYERAENTPPEDVAERIADLLMKPAGVEPPVPLRLVSETDRPPIRRTPDSPVAYSGSGMLEVAEFGEVGAGPGRVPLEPIGFRLISIEQFVIDFGTVPRSDGLITGRGYFIVIGDSAAPVYFDRESVPVEVLPEPTQAFQQDTLYVFRWNDVLLLKRLRKLPSGEIRAVSLNPSVDPFVFKPDGEHDFVVLAIAREKQKQQLYAALVGRFLRVEEQ